jgi:TrpR family transcriptional regulator, trp operon repressor
MRSETDIIGVFAAVRDATTMRRLFGELFTSAERRDFALRWRLMRLLHAGASQREVAARLGISLCKITRGARVLKGRRAVTRLILDQWQSKRKGRTR